jgi:hypothetical protein
VALLTLKLKSDLGLQRVERPLVVDSRRVALELFPKA